MNIVLSVVFDLLNMYVIAHCFIAKPSMFGRAMARYFPSLDSGVLSFLTQFYFIRLDLMGRAEIQGARSLSARPRLAVP